MFKSKMEWAVFAVVIVLSKRINDGIFFVEMKALPFVYMTADIQLGIQEQVNRR